MKRIACLVLALSSAHVFASVDYSKCARYLNPLLPAGGEKEADFDSGGMGGGFGFGVGMGGGYGMLPFTLKPDGEVVANDGANYKRDPKTGAETIEVEYSFPGMDGKTQKYKNSYTIERDSEGKPTSINQNWNYTKQQLDQWREMQTKNNPYWEKKEGEEAPVLPMYLYKTSKLALEYKNGQCVVKDLVIESEDVNDKGIPPKLSQTIFNTGFCRNLNDLLKKHPEAEACFNKDLNKKFSDVFQGFVKENHQKLNIPPMGMMGGWGMGMGGPYGMDLTSQVMFQAPEGSKLMGSSPVISAHKIVETCKVQGLQRFYADDQLWVTENKATASESDSSAVAR
jgi:hypothetical protein